MAEPSGSSARQGSSGRQLSPVGLVMVLAIVGASLVTFVPWDRETVRAEGAVSPAGQIGPSSSGGAVTAQDWSASFFLPYWANTKEAVVAVDPNGGIHAAYSPASGDSQGKYNAYYAYCASNCGLATSWDGIAVGDVGAWGGFVRLALTPPGRQLV